MTRKLLPLHLQSRVNTHSVARWVCILELWKLFRGALCFRFSKRNLMEKWSRSKLRACTVRAVA